MPIIRTTRRLILRDFTPDDFEAVHAYGSDLLVVQHMTFGPNDMHETREFLNKADAEQHIEPRNDYTLGIELKENGKLIGGCGIYKSKGTHSRAFIGFLLNREYWGKGYATEAARELVRFGFDELKLHRIFARVFPENAASIRVLEKCGMIREGLLRDEHFVRGSWRSWYIYAILEHEYRSSPIYFDTV